MCACVYYAFWECLERDYYANARKIRDICARSGELRRDYDRFLAEYYRCRDECPSDFDAWENGAFVADNSISAAMVEILQSMFEDELGSAAAPHELTNHTDHARTN